MNLFKKQKKDPRAAYLDEFSPGKAIQGNEFDMIPTDNDNPYEYKMVANQTFPYTLRPYIHDEGYRIQYIPKNTEGGIFEFSQNEDILYEQLRYINRNQRSSSLWIEEGSSVRGNIIPKETLLLFDQSTIENKSDDIPIIVEDVRFFNSTCIRDVPEHEQLSPREQTNIVEKGGGLQLRRLVSEYSDIIDQSNTTNGTQLNGIFNLKQNELLNNNFKHVYFENTPRGCDLSGNDLQGVYITGDSVLKGNAIRLHQIDNMEPERYEFAVKEAQFMKHFIIDSDFTRTTIDTELSSLAFVNSNTKDDKFETTHDYQAEEYSLVLNNKLQKQLSEEDVQEYLMNIDANVKNHCLTTLEWLDPEGYSTELSREYYGISDWSEEKSALDTIKLSNSALLEAALGEDYVNNLEKERKEKEREEKEKQERNNKILDELFGIDEDIQDVEVDTVVEEVQDVKDDATYVGDLSNILNKHKK